MYQNYLDGSGNVLKTTAPFNISLNVSNCTGVILLWNWY